jgi:hypothetical protein
VYVIEPVSGGTHGWAFGASLRDLSEVGYLETEFFIEGEASRYGLCGGTDHAFDGSWAAEERGTARYRTRMLVRRPVDPARFNLQRYGGRELEQRVERLRESAGPE